MRDQMWLKQNIPDMTGITVAVTGPTGGLGVPLCRFLLMKNARLILLGRRKIQSLRERLLQEFPRASIETEELDLSDMDSVKKACDRLKQQTIDVLFHNAGVYAVEPRICSTGFNLQFQTNFISPYFMTAQLLPYLEQRRGKVVVTGSVAHQYSQSDPDNPDFTGRKIHKIYGNSKRYLMFAMESLLKQYPHVSLAVSHPGLAFTEMSNHFPPTVYRILRWPMKLIYMKPEKSARSLIRAVTANVPSGCWIGPRFFHIWGNPKISKLNTCSREEKAEICRTAENIYKKLESEGG